MSAIEELNQAQSQQEVECCPEFHPEKWNEKTFYWEGKKFIKTSVPEFFHVPYPPMIGQRIVQMMQLAQKAEALDKDLTDSLLLFTDPHPFRGDIYLSVMHEVPGAHNTTLTGTFMCKVFEGDYKQIPKFVKEMDRYLEGKARKGKAYYVHYAYCPKCAKKFGHNYMALFAHVVYNN